MLDYLQLLKTEFENNADNSIAKQQEAYMRNKFDFFGIKAVRRKEIQRPFLVQSYLPDKTDLFNIVHFCWEQPQREFQYFAQELAYKFRKNFIISDISTFQYMIINKSWWDTVDFIAIKLLGTYFKLYPLQRHKYVEECLASDNIWLQRSALLFQLKYKDEMDEKLMRFTINALLDSNEFFINKLVGFCANTAKPIPNGSLVL